MISIVKVVLIFMLKGESPKMVDYLIWPWFERFEMAERLAGGVHILPKDKFSKLNSWVVHMKEYPAVRASMVGTAQLVKLFESMRKKDGIPDYDIGLEE